MKNNKPYTPPLNGQKAHGSARCAQTFPIQCLTRLMVWIFQIAPLLLAQEAYAAVSRELPTAYPTNGALTTDASGYRNNSDGEQYNVGSNGNYWSFAPYSQTGARNLNFNSGNVYPLNNNERANGFSVRPSRALGTAAGFPKTTGMRYSFEKIHELVTVAYLKAREEERATPSQIEFELNLERNITTLARDIHRRDWYPGPLDWFVNLDPTVREVYAPNFRDRIVSHVLYLLISPIFERYFVFDSFSCREGKGTLVGIERLEHHIRSVTDNYRREAYALNYDIRAYFMSIVRSRLYEIISTTLARHERRFPDLIDYGMTDWLLRIFILEREPFLGSTYHGKPCLIRLIQPGKSITDQLPGIGIPIGDVLNQLCSNIYLNVFDQFVMRTLLICHAVRYVDDGKMLHESAAFLAECRDRAGEFLKERLSLELHPTKTTITPLSETTYFLGAALKPYRRYVCNETARRFRKYIREADAALENGASPYDILSDINSRLGYLSHFDAWRIIDRAVASAPAVTRYFDFTKDYTKATIKS